MDKPTRSELVAEYASCKFFVKYAEEQLVDAKLALQSAELALYDYDERCRVTPSPSPPPSTSATNEPPRDGVGG